jgi:hypothetical protein
MVHDRKSLQRWTDYLPSAHLQILPAGKKERRNAVCKKAGAKIRTSLRKATLSLLVCGLTVLTACAPYIESFTPEEGVPGTEVIIKGTGFGASPAENTVKFTGVTVPTTHITSASTTQIKAKVPAGAETGLISVTTSKGTGESKKNFIIPRDAKWTFMVYLDADNNLESAGIDDFLEMASVGSTTAVNIVVQMDRVAGHTSAYGNWTGTRRFLIQSGDDPGGTPVQDLGEQNMGDPAVLQDFVEWAVTNYRADHYALAIWNHGDGWRTLQERMLERALDAKSRGESDWAVARGVASDDTDGDKLYMKEVQTALEAAKQGLQDRLNLAVKLDLVGFDACLMGMVEVAYALRDVTNYMVGSEELEPGDGWPYDAILGDLTATPEMTPVQLADLIVTEYGSSYSSGITQSAVDIGKMGTLLSKVNAFANTAHGEWSELEAARTHTMQYHPWWSASCWGVDLWDFADEVHSRVVSPTIKTAALDLKTAIDDFVVSEYHSSDMAGSHGMAIYFPPTQTEFNSDPEHAGYEESNTFMPVDFVKYSKWDNWLQDFYSNIP